MKPLQKRMLSSFCRILAYSVDKPAQFAPKQDIRDLKSTADAERCQQKGIKQKKRQSSAEVRLGKS